MCLWNSLPANTHLDTVVAALYQNFILTYIFAFVFLFIFWWSLTYKQVYIFMRFQSRFFNYWGFNKINDGELKSENHEI